MLNIGDKVVYPMHGAGIIEAIEEKEVLGEKRKYFVVRIPLGGMRVMISIDSVDILGIRRVISPEQAEAVFEVLSDNATVMDKSWSKRYRQNELKIKTGNIYEIAEIVRNLTIMDRHKKLSTGEKKMLTNARNLLISELMLAKDATQEEIEDVLEKIIK